MRAELSSPAAPRLSAGGAASRVARATESTATLWSRLCALATRIHARADHTLHEARLGNGTATHSAAIGPYFPAELTATLGTFAGAALVWSGPGGQRGALRVPALAELTHGWRPAHELGGLDSSAAAYVCIDEGDGNDRGLLVIDERGRTRYEWLPADGPSLVVATTLHGYLERCLARAARRRWPLAVDEAGVALPHAIEAAPHARAGVHSRSIRELSLDEVRARRLAALPKHGQLLEALQVSADRLVAAVVGIDPRRPPKALASVLRGRRTAPRTVGELRRWALADEEPTPWLELTLAVELPEAGVAVVRPREAWLALCAAPGGGVALGEAERMRLADDARAEPAPDDAALVSLGPDGEVTLTVPTARAPRGCADGARWTAVLPPAPRTRVR